MDCNSTTNEIKQSVDILYEIDAKCRNYDSSLVYNYPDERDHVANIKLFSQSGVAVKLEVSYHSDEYDSSTYMDKYYFYPQGKLFAIMYHEYENETQFRFFKPDYIIDVKKHMNKYIDKKIYDCSYTQAIARHLDLIFMNSPDVKYDNIYCIAHDVPGLRTYSMVELKEKPDKNSRTIKFIYKNNDLYFLKSSNIIDSINGKKWPWYYVETLDGLKGWVWAPRDKMDFHDDGD